MIEDNTGFGTYQLYTSLKLHFTSDTYDYFKYKGKTSVTKDTFMKRNDKYTFHKLSRKFNLVDMRNYMISNFINDNGKWIGDMVGPEGEVHYKNWLRIQQSLTYTFENDLYSLLDNVDSPNRLLEVKDGQFPVLLSKSLNNTITTESLLILNGIMNFFPMWDRNIHDDILWPNIKMRYLKYQPFLEYDKDKFKKIVVKLLKKD